MATNAVYYNDNDPFVCEWLRCLIKKGLIPDGSVDSRSIVDVVPGDLGPFRQCHFFAGIGGWAHALTLAGYEGECWTASLPCQPLSVAGARQGDLDGRHLWPAFYRLVVVCKPPVIFGEQVAGKVGREWLAGVRLDLDELGYACGAACLPACSVGAPHRRERLFWGAVGDAEATGLAVAERDAGGNSGEDGSSEGEGSGETGGGFWDDAEWRIGADGKTRRVKPGVRLLADGVPNRVGALRGLGNAIVAQVAAEFVAAFLAAASTLAAGVTGHGPG